MSDLDWEDSKNKEVIPKTLILAKEYKDEETLEDVKDNWDDEEEVEVVEEPPSAPVAIKSIKLQNASHINATKSKVKTEESYVPSRHGMTGEEELAEKLRLQKLAEDADYEIACEMFGIEGAPLFSKTPRGIDVDNFDRSSTLSSATNASKSMAPSQTHNGTTPVSSTSQADIESYIRSALKEGCPSVSLPVPRNNREDYEKLAGALKGLLGTIKDSSHFHFLAEEIIRYICFQISATDVKKLSIMMDTVSLEKLKTKQVEKKKKPVAVKTKKPTLKKTSEQDYDNYMAPENYDDYDDMF